MDILLQLGKGILTEAAGGILAVAAIAYVQHIVKALRKRHQEEDDHDSDRTASS